MNAISPNRNYRHPGPRRIRGVGLIEVLVAVAILAFGLLGIAAMQATALKNGQSSYERSQAVTLTYSILDRMRANKAAANFIDYSIPRTCTVPATGTDRIANDLHDWITALQADDALGPDACGTINCVANATISDVWDCAITVEWDDSRGTQGDPNQTLATETHI